MQHIRNIQIELTSRCNERCVHCIYPHKTKNKDMDTSFVFNLIDQCRELKVEQLTISGGEPLIHKDFMPILRKTCESNIVPRIFTNATLLTNEMIAEWKTMPIKEVQVSLYSVEASIHDKVTGVHGSCDASIKAIEKLVDNGISTRISSAVMKQNAHSYAGIITLAKKLKIDSVPCLSIVARLDHTVDNLENRHNIEDALFAVKDMLKYDNAYESDRYDPDYKNLDNVLPLAFHLCHDYLAVAVNGEARAYPAWDYPLGNMHSQSLLEIWENSAKIKYIRSVGFKDFPKCQTCPDIQFCGMGLEGNANENPDGNPFIIPEYECELARRSRELVHAWKITKEKT